MGTMLGWTQISQSIAASDDMVSGKPIFPGESTYHHKLPTHRTWDKQEIWAWEQRICLGKIADMSKYPEDNNSFCDSKEVENWPETRKQSSAFLETIINHTTYRDALTRRGADTRCARFNETVAFSSIVAHHTLRQEHSRFRRLS